MSSHGQPQHAHPMASHCRVGCFGWQVCLRNRSDRSNRKCSPPLRAVQGAFHVLCTVSMHVGSKIACASSSAIQCLQAADANWRRGAVPTAPESTVRFLPAPGKKRLPADLAVHKSVRCQAQGCRLAVKARWRAHASAARRKAADHKLTCLLCAVRACAPRCAQKRQPPGARMPVTASWACVGRRGCAQAPVSRRAQDRLRQPPAPC